MIGCTFFQLHLALHHRSIGFLEAIADKRLGHHPAERLVDRGQNQGCAAAQHVRHLGRLEEAEAALNRALSLLRDSSLVDPMFARNALTELAEVHRNQGRFALALEELDEAQRLHEELVGEDSPSKRLLRLRTSVHERAADAESVPTREGETSITAPAVEATPSD